MSVSLGLGPEIVAYLARANPPLHPVLERCRAETAADPMARMQISAEQGAFLAFLLRLMRARRVVEIGVFTGYSSLAMALALKEMHQHDAHLLACDVSDEWTSRAQTYWRAAGVDDVIRLQIGPAAETLQHHLDGGEGGSYDFAFIDADKTNYIEYYELSLSLLRIGGVMAFDNVLWSGRVADLDQQDADTAALRRLAAHARNDIRTESVMTAIGDGLLLCRKLG